MQAFRITTDNLKSIHDELRLLRLRKSMSQKATATEIGMSPSALCRFEQTGRASAMTLLKILGWIQENRDDQEGVEIGE